MHRDDDVAERHITTRRCTNPHVIRGSRHGFDRTLQTSHEMVVVQVCARFWHIEYYIMFCIAVYHQVGLIGCAYILIGIAAV